VRPRGPVAAALLRAVQGAGGDVGGGEDARKPRRGRPRKAQPTAVGGAARPEEPRTPLRKPREVRSDRAMAQWVAAEKKGRIKVVVAAVQSAGRHTLGVMHKATHPLLQQALSGWERRRMILVGTGSQAGHMRVQGRAVPASAQRTKPCSTEKLGTRQAAHGHVHRGASA
jgi:hypothetical protein